MIIKGQRALRGASGEKRLTMEYIPQLRMTLLTVKQKPATRIAAGTLRSGELARLAGVSRDTLRHYERQELLPAAERSQNGYRQYPAQALDRVRIVRAALGIGFTVEEMRELLRMRDRGDAPCQHVYALAKLKARELKARMRELKALHGALQRAIRAWDRRLKSTAPGKRAGLLEMFVANHPESVRSISPQMSPGLKRKLQGNEGRKK
jgi:DNA-binding transcriptional MerR regulator